MFESTGKMSIPALSFFLTALRQVSNTFVSGLASTFSTVSGSATNNVTGQTVLKMWAVERMLSTLMFNVHRKASLEYCITDLLLFSIILLFSLVAYCNHVYVQLAFKTLGTAKVKLFYFLFCNRFGACVGSGHRPPFGGKERFCR